MSPEPSTLEAAPTVDVVMCAYNYGRYVGRALQSALDQDYPADRLRVIVIDDGSTDDTAAIVRAIAARHPGRVKLISQANGGLRAAINRAFDEAEAELVALLDADDVWLREKTRLQAQALAADPALGMVFCDMTVVDGDEQVVRPSQVGNIGEFRSEKALARLLCQNVVTQSSIVMRRELVRPLPEGITYSDWWLALCAAERTGVRYLPEKLALYREHGANLTSGVSGAAEVRERRKEIRFHLWTLRHLQLEPLSAGELRQVWQAIELKAQAAVRANGSCLVELVGRDETDPSEAERLRELGAAATSEGDLSNAAIALTRALAWDPLSPAGRPALDAILAAAEAAAAEPHPLREAQGFVVLASAEDLLADDVLLTQWAQDMAGTAATLAIDATRLSTESAGAALQALVSRCGLDTRDDLELLAVVGEHSSAQLFRMRGRADAHYGAPAGALSTGPGPAFTPATLGELSALARQQAPQSAH